MAKPRKLVRERCVVGAFEAKTKLSRLLERVARGETITITRNGVPVARLAPVFPMATKSAAELRAEFLTFQASHPLEGVTTRDLVIEGRHR